MGATTPAVTPLEPAQEMKFAIFLDSAWTLSSHQAPPLHVKAPLGKMGMRMGMRTVIQNWIGLKEYLGLFTVLTLVLGGTFQLPVIMIGMEMPRTLA